MILVCSGRFNLKSVSIWVVARLPEDSYLLYSLQWIFERWSQIGTVCFFFNLLLLSLRNRWMESVVLMDWLVKGHSIMTNRKRRSRKTTIKSADISYHPSCCNCIMWLMLKQLVEHKNRLTALILPRGDGDGDGRISQRSTGSRALCLCREPEVRHLTWPKNGV